jgi:hypothetical protein
MLEKGLDSGQILTGSLLVLSFIIFAVGASMYSGRAILSWPVGQTRGYLVWERGLVIAALVVLILGLAMLERMLAAAGETILAPLAMVTFFTGAILILVAETLALSKYDFPYAPTLVYIVLAFLSQAAFGAALLRSGLLPGWIGWATILWNLGWLVILPAARPQNMYYPWLHHIAPLLIGIGLLVKG